MSKVVVYSMTFTYVDSFLRLLDKYNEYYIQITLTCLVKCSKDSL